MRALLLFVLLLPNVVVAGWTQLSHRFNQIVSCGYFLDENNGFVGTCHFIDYGTPQIWRTTDGGLTWSRAATPNLSGRDGRVTSIFMKGPLIGYATIAESSYDIGEFENSLWKTIDGGLTWFDHTQRNEIEAVNVYATSSALIVTGWRRFGSREGGRSLDDGASYTQAFSTSGESESNGVDFADDLQGVVTPGPSLNSRIRNNYLRACYFTIDGGRNWSEGEKISESWSVYALKGTSTFFALPEGYAGDIQTQVIWTTNTGRSWQPRFLFPPTHAFTGHIDGVGASIYVQSEVSSDQNGLFRSDDLGMTWKNVGGPSNLRDSRFVVTGCKGQVVYAFDGFGGVWKTTDGGDGTLSGGSGANLTLSFDSLTLTTVCTPVRDWIPVMINGCGDTVIVDELRIENDTTSQFAVDTISSGLISPMGEVLLIPITYTPKNSGSQEVRLRLLAHTSTGTIDTIVTITGRTVKLPEPYVPDIERGVAGDTVRIPIYLDKTLDPFSITDYEVRMSFNTDLIEPIAIDTIGTLTRDIRNLSFVPLNSGLFCRFSLLKPINESGDLSQPLLVILARVYLTSQASTTVTVDSFNVTSGTLKASLLGCSERISSFTINYVCGDSTISAFMRTGVVSITNIRPNPNMTGSLDLEVGTAQDMETTVEAINALGVVVKRFDPLPLSSGSNALRISTEGLVSGLYYFRLITPYGVSVSDPVAIVR